MIAPQGSSQGRGQRFEEQKMDRSVDKIGEGDEELRGERKDEARE